MLSPCPEHKLPLSLPKTRFEHSDGVVAKDRIRDNVAEPFDGPSAGRILPERNVGPNLFIIGRVFPKDSPKVLGVEHQQMVRALAPDRADQAFNISVLPRGTE